MKSYTALTNTIPRPPDTTQTLLLAGGTAQAMDWAGSTIGSTAVRANIVRFTGVSSAGVTLNFHVNVISTHAALPTSGTAITTGTTVGSTGNSLPVLGQGSYLIPSFSTGWSAIARTSGYVIAEIWSK
jgi:hypothetical protein